MILIYGECNKNTADNKRFFTISFNQENDVYVKICETAQLFCFFKKQISTLTSQMYCGLHFQFRRVHYYSRNTLYTT
jgi:hypothetical protein